MGTNSRLKGKSFSYLLRRISDKVFDSVTPANHSPLRRGKNGTYIFIHINKTGGTSVGRAIGLRDIRHHTVKQVIDLIGREEFDKAYRFAVVRNPWSKVVSHYRYRVRTNQTGMGDKHISFEDWVKCTLGPSKDKTYYDQPKMFQAQVDWLKDHQGVIAVEDVIKFESLNSDYKSIQKKIGLKRPLDKLNSGKSVDYSSFYNEETKAIVSAWYAEDIEHFGFKFD